MAVLHFCVQKIFIVDDYEPFRRHLRDLIESQDDWKVCCEASDGSEAVEMYPAAHPHLTVMDFNMPGLDGLKASRQILAKDPSAVILMVSVILSEQLAKEVKRAGIKGFCPKTHGDCILIAIETVLRGETYFPPPFKASHARPA